MHEPLSEQKSSEQANWEFTHLEDLPTVALPVSSLLLDNSPRQDGESDEHVRILAESEQQLPPIVVHGETMRVIDGIHRVRAAMLRGDEKIAAKIYNRTEDDAFVLAVRMNVAHGLPLSRADRIAAAARIVGSHPQWSNRMIAAATGLSAGTIGAVRRRSTAQNAQSNTRIGKDGRMRPIDNAAGRLKARELVAEQPTASTRAIAKEAGVSPSTVHDLRKRLRARLESAQERRNVHESPMTSQQLTAGSPRRDPEGQESTESTDADAILGSLKEDPMLRFSDEGRLLLGWLERYSIGPEAPHKIVETVPHHCANSVAKLARRYARVWTEVATQLEGR